jgi:hypothetical protein
MGALRPHRALDGDGDGYGGRIANCRVAKSEWPSVFDIDIDILC